MALLERGLKQRIVGALVLIALAVIFLPMLFTREDESRQVVVEAPPRPQSPAMPSVEAARRGRHRSRDRRGRLPGRRRPAQPADRRPAGEIGRAHV